MRLAGPSVRNLSLINTKSSGQITWKLAVYAKLSDRCQQSASIIARRQFGIELHNLAAPPSRKSHGCLSSLLVGCGIFPPSLPFSLLSCHPFAYTLVLPHPSRRLNLDSGISPAAISRNQQHQRDAFQIQLYFFFTLKYFTGF